MVPRFPHPGTPSHRNGLAPTCPRTRLSIFPHPHHHHLVLVGGGGAKRSKKEKEKRERYGKERKGKVRKGADVSLEGYIRRRKGRDVKRTEWNKELDPWVHSEQLHNGCIIQMIIYPRAPAPSTHQRINASDQRSVTDPRTHHTRTEPNRTEPRLQTLGGGGFEGKGRTMVV